VKPPVVMIGGFTVSAFSVIFYFQDIQHNPHGVWIASIVFYIIYPIIPQKHQHFYILPLKVL
jgi:hypothetical protein